MNCLHALTDHSIKRSETEVFCILRDIAMGLRYLHRLGYIHLDLKLGNVVIVNGRAKIIDFESIYYFGRPATELASTVNIMPPGMYSFVC
jgi:serine/threonine protein kinase